MSSVDIPLPGTQASTLHVDGTITDWVRPIEDCVYDYLRDKWSIDIPKRNDGDSIEIKLKKNNRAYDGNGSHHFWVERKQLTINRDTIDGQFWNCIATLQINVLMKRLSKGETDDDLDEMLREIRRSLIEYNPDWIAGIDEFDNFIEVPLVYGPDDEKNPFRNTWIAAISVNAYYVLNTQFSIDTSQYNPARFSAGELSYKLNSS